MPEDIVYAEVVVGKYVGEQAKLIAAEARASRTYRVMSEGKDKTIPWIIVMFRRALDRPTPSHLTKVVDPIKIAEFERWRQG